MTRNTLKKSSGYKNQDVETGLKQNLEQGAHRPIIATECQGCACTDSLLPLTFRVSKVNLTARPLNKNYVFVFTLKRALGTLVIWDGLPESVKVARQK